jgi:hypothetical protein
MAKEPWLIDTVAFGNGAPTTAAGRTTQRAFDGKNELAFLGQFGLENTQIRNVEWYRDKRVLRHQAASLRYRANEGVILQYLGPPRNPYI